MGDAKTLRMKACVFDAYGTLFDVNSAARNCKAELGERWKRLADHWRLKQLQYTWLRSLMGHFADFWQVTGDSLDHAMDTVGVKNPKLRARLMQLYLTPETYPEVKTVLLRLRKAGVKVAVLSNGSKSMLLSAAKHAGIHNLVDKLMSADKTRIYKPHPSVYQMVIDDLEVAPEEVCFFSSNAWDVSGAASFGFNSTWINRDDMIPENLPGQPTRVVTDLEEATRDLDALREEGELV